MNRLLELPNLSEPFVRHIGDHILEPNEWMPCPRCGSAEVELPGTGSMLLGSFAGFGCIMPGCGCLGIGIMAISWFFVGVAAWPIALVLVFFGAVLGLLLALSGRVYRCGSCEYNWSYREVEAFREQSRPEGG